MGYLRWVLVFVLLAGTSPGDPKMNRDVQEIIKKCLSAGKCSSVARTIKVIDQTKESPEPILFLRTPMVNEFKIVRFMSSDGPYILFIIPEGFVDMGIVGVFEGR